MPNHDEPRPDQPATIGRYRIVSRLGAGGQGIVYLATGPQGEQVAIKQLRAGLEDDRARQLLTKEVAAARLVAPFCTAQVLDARLDGPAPYVVSEYIEGPSLQQYVERHGPMKGIELERLAIGTATALAAIHQAGVVHRDFKPANVMLAKNGPRVIDFGIARDLTAETTVTSRVFGTPAYMAPEQLRAEKVGPPTDMFAWASVVAFAATGQAPFEAEHMVAMVHRIAHEQPDLSDVPADVREVIERCLNKDPALRLSAQQALAVLLGRPMPSQDRADAAAVLAEATGLVRSTRVKTPERPRSSRPRAGGTRRGPLRRRWGLALVAAAVIVGLGVWLALRDGESPAAAESTSSTPSSSPSAGKTTSASGDSSAPLAPATFGGNWTGPVFQSSGGTTVWTAKLALREGSGKGTFSSTELNCSGTMTVVSADNFSLALNVVIKKDPDQHCAARGTIHLIKVADDRATMVWQDEGTGGRSASGLLARS